MSVIWVIGKNTFREIIRDRVLYGLVVFALLIIFFSLALGQLSFAEQARISANFGLTAIHLSAVALSVFVGSSLVVKEIEKKTVMTLLTRPISRLGFLLGKSLGLMLVLATLMIGFAAILCLIFAALKMPISLTFAGALIGVFMEASILLGFALLFSSFTTPFMVVAFSVGIFLIGHWLNSLAYFAEHSESGGFKGMIYVITAVLPDFEKLNWRSHVIYEDAIPPLEFLAAGGYTIAWLVLLLSLTAIILGRKDFA